MSRTLHLIYLEGVFLAFAPSKFKEKRVLKIYIVRHGETKLNSEGRLQGWIDEPLIESGRELAKITGQKLSDICFHAAYSSPLKRAFETGQLIISENKAGSTDKIITDDRLKEINFGEWDGLCCTKSNFEIGDDSFWKIYSDPFHYEGPANGESILDVCKRTGAFWDELVSDKSLQDKNVIIFMHGCSLRAMLRKVYPADEPFWHGHTPPNCSVNIIEVVGAKAKLIEDDKVYYDENLISNAYDQ